MKSLQRLLLTSATAMLAVLLSACSSDLPENAYFKVSYVEADTELRPITVIVDLDLKFSTAVEEALNKGVTIPIKATARIRHNNSWGRVVADHGHRWEIRYLPMSRHYLLSDLKSGEETTWPRLRHVLASLKRIKISLPVDELEPGDYWIEVRVFLDRRRLPAPMRLPALVSSAWKLETNWYQWPFQITK